MGEIRKDNLHESLIEELNKLANIDLSGKQDKTDESLLTESKDLVGAINELFQNANNGKELIASAIGEPLNAEDTFSAMSNDINGLLSTFKTNMMNNGIVVESTDKFKQLIDKLISDNTNKEEITYLFNAPDYYNEEFYNDLKTHSTHIEGYSYPVITLKDDVNNGVMSFNMTGSTSSGFTGTNCVLSVFTNNKIDLTNVTSIKIVAKRTSGKAVTSFGIFSQFVSVGHPGHPDFAKYITIATTDSYIEYTLDTTEVIGEHYIGITVTTSNLTNKGKAYVYVQSIMLTSIGKNDALRDSLASILEEEGVEVTEEDDMASLIGKVDSEFDRKNANSGLDIISATELPATGKENQICVITDNPVDKYYASSIYEDIQSINSEHIGIYLVDYKPENIYNGSTISVGDTFKIDYNIARFIQDSNRLPAYIYKNNAWEEFYIPAIYLLEDKVMQNTDIFGNIVNSNATAKVSYTSGTGININGSCHASLSNSIDFSLYKSVIITAYCAYNVTRKITISQLRGTSAGIGDPSSMNIVKSASLTFSASPTTVTCDISSWTGTGYFCLSNNTMAPGQYFYITDIYFV